MMKEERKEKWESQVNTTRNWHEWASRWRDWRRLRGKKQNIKYTIFFPFAIKWFGGGGATVGCGIWVLVETEVKRRMVVRRRRGRDRENVSNEQYIISFSRTSIMAVVNPAPSPCHTSFRVPESISPRVHLLFYLFSWTYSHFHKRMTSVDAEPCRLVHILVEFVVLCVMSMCDLCERSVYAGGYFSFDIHRVLVSCSIYSQSVREFAVKWWRTTKKSPALST